MKDYKKYQHIEKIGSDEVQGIEMGRCYIFPKIDGTNAQVWYCPQTRRLRCGSRNRELSLEKDNAGFMAWATQNERLINLSKHFSGHRIYGEWLVPHSLKTYRDDSWRDFYVFDVWHEESDRYLPYETYQAGCEAAGVNYIPPLRVINNPKIDNINRCLDQNVFLIQDGEGVGEGVVVKNYAFANQFGRTVWAKVVTSSFKERHHKEMGAPETNGTSYIEEAIVWDFQTQDMMDKVMANIRSDTGFSSRNIPQLLNTIFYDLVRECTWDFVKKYKHPTIDFKVLKRFSVVRSKEHFSDVF